VLSNQCGAKIKNPPLIAGGLYAKLEYPELGFIKLQFLLLNFVKAEYNGE
jgi:hypothetical protein